MTKRLRDEWAIESSILSKKRKSENFSTQKEDTDNDSDSAYEAAEEKDSERKFFNVAINENSNGVNGTNSPNAVNNIEIKHTNSSSLKSECAESPEKSQLPPSIIDGLKKMEKNEITSREEQSNKVRLEALKQRALEKKVRMERITQALRNDCQLTKSKGRLLFSDNEDSAIDKSPGKFNLFDSDSEEREERSMDITINPIFEGSSGRERLNTQKRFHGDHRFKLTEDFVSDDDTNEKNAPVGHTDLDNEITKFLEEEKSKRLGILNELLGGDSKFEQQKRKSKEWKEMVHFDPDMPEAKSLEIPRNEGLSEVTFESKLSSTQPLPIVSKEVKIEINADLKGIFAPGVKNLTSFPLFSIDGKNEDTTAENHNVDEGVMESSLPTYIFDDSEEIVSSWKETSRDMTIEYKRKHKSVSRKLQKIKSKRRLG
ncbi:2448_t:CDS:2 [Acaulospora colombiana]|uniref:2448_t:CDS:1 n=1 Tax=Acaulospora colombiana TaxID=27376 RepID=A0ACA9LE85_9GLOM|nr:2448_t:CDS:2 [Acaulospora colombiana]